jgi:NTE family protein
VRSSVGNDLWLSSELYQPLDAASHYFIQPRVSLGTLELSVFEGDQRVAEIEPEYLVGELSGGVDISNDLRLSAFARRGIGEVTEQTGTAPQIADNFEIGSIGLYVLYDTLDNLWWPRSGQLVVSSYEWGLQELGADPEYQTTTLRASVAEPIGGATVLGAFRGSLTLDGEQPVSGFTRLGGFLRLSGFASDTLSNDNALLSRLVIFDEAARLGQGFLFGLPLYYGGSLEYGGVFADIEDLGSFADYIAAGSLFLGADTPVGPVYLAYGHAEGGNDAVYLFLGRPF